ncbi:MAG: TonB-dependent receptor [Bryobacterales bacterium]|nr:TonB-dependent receptor [Bryobacterales bacterium]
MKNLSRFSLAAVLALGLAASSYAQIGTATLTGRVTDTTGAVVPNAAVNVVQIGTNFTFNATTNEEGLYRVLSLQPGQYRVSVEAQGFKKFLREDVELRSGDTQAVDVAMQVGNVSETVEVTGATQLLETETSATGSTMAGNVLYDLPLYQRFVNSTLNLVPGMTTGGYAYGGSLGAYHLAGQRSGAIGIFEDGVNGNDQTGGTETIKPIQNAVAEVKVLTTVPPAEYGHSAGGVISVAKKSGTNELHGMASFYGRSRRMQHRLFFDRLKTSQPAPGRPGGLPTQFMMPDANVSGPIYIPKVYDGRNKTFFFFAYQWLHEKKVAQVDATTPTADMKAGNFNFPGVANSNIIYDPATTRRNPDGTWSRSPFPGNMVPTNRFDPVAQRLLAIDPWVAPNRPGTYNAQGPSGNLLADEFARVFLPDYSLRLDHQFSPAFKIYGSYTDNLYSGFGRPINIKEANPEFDSSQGNWTPSRNSNVSLGKTWIVTPTLVNDARAGYYRRFAKTDVPSFGQNWAQQLGIPNVGSELMPGFGGTSTGRYDPSGLYGIYGATPSRSVNETLSFRNDTAYIRGTHAIKFGYEYLKFRLNNAILAYPAQFAFDTSTVGLQPNGQPIPNTGNQFAGFLTGYVSQAIFRGELSSWLPRSSIHSFYIQDDWKVTPTLTANIGLRYSNEAPFNTKFGVMSNFDPNGRDPLTGRTGAIIHPTSGLNKRDNNNFNPRIGLAWHPKERLVFRGGFGMYTVDVKFPLNREQYDEYQTLVNQQPAPGDPTPIYRISQGVRPPSPTVQPNNTALYSGANFGSRNVSWWDPNLRNPYTLNWNTSIQYEFVRDYLIEVSYQGSSGVGLLERWQANTFAPDFAANDLTLRNQVFAAAQNFRPYSQFGDVIMRSNFGHSTFHSGTVKLEKRYSQGFFFSTFYTLSKALNSQDTDNAGAGVAPITNRALEKGRAGYDRNHRFIGTINYELPFGKGKKFLNGGGWKNLLFGGYEISWIQTMESGNPLTFTFANSPYNYYPGFAGSRRPDLVSEPDYDFGKWNNGGPDRFTLQNRPAVIDINAFAMPGGCAATGTISQADRDRCSFRIGNAGRNILTGPRLVWSQVSAQKNFFITEKVKAQLRWDFQNALKTYNFTGPTTTVDFVNPRTFGRLTDDPRTASLGGQPLMNITVMLQF